MESARILLHGMFVLVGVATTMLGPLLPTLLRRWKLSDGEAGFLFSALFVMSVLSSTAVGWLLHHFPAWRLMAVGFVLCGIGSLGFSSASTGLGFAGACLLGLGMGIVSPCANLAAASLRPANPAGALNLLNFFFSAGAMGSPLVVAWAIGQGWVTWFPAAVAALLLAGAMLASRLFVANYQRVEHLAHVEPLHEIGKRRRPFAVLTMGLLFLYVGIEVAMGGWTASYLIRFGDASQAFAAVAPSTFWGAILASRLATVALLPRFGALRVVLGGILLSVAGTLGMLLVPSAPLSLCGIAIAGAGMGPIFPNTVGYFLEHYGRGAERFTGLLFAAGGVGGAMLPFVVGAISEATGNLELALWTLPMAAALLLGTLSLVVRNRPQPGVAPA